LISESFFTAAAIPLMHLGLKISIKNIFNEERDMSRIFNERLFQKNCTRGGGGLEIFIRSERKKISVNFL
jgi:hypothetical protein